jgi:DNA processing protein
MEHPSVYQLALRRVRGIGTVYTRNLIKRFGDAASVFRASRSDLEQTGLHTRVVDAILNFTDFRPFVIELNKMQSMGIRTLFFTDPDYPRRLVDLPNAPPLLFYQGVADLNSERTVAVAGTRSPTLYGKQVTATIIRELAQPGLVILSGLAFGIDVVAHRTALENDMQTIGIIGHGLYHVYPAEHAGFFRKMRQQGGLLTPFPPETKPERHTFLIRNKLVAALCDTLLIMETGTVGGSLSAADAAREFGKKIFALPGRITDEKSLGCLHLIDQQHAAPLLSANQLNAAMGWQWAAGSDSHQPRLPFATPTHPLASLPTSAHPTPSPLTPAHHNPPHPTSNRPDPSHPAAPQLRSNQPLPPIETQILQLLRGQQPLTFEDLINMTQQTARDLSVALLNLELRDAIKSLPGRRYQPAS